MGTHVCSHCGELYEEGKLVCPHCGADADHTYAETPSEFAVPSDDEDYERFLDAEGLTAPKPLKGGFCALVVLLPGGVLLWLLLL